MTTSVIEMEEFGESRVVSMTDSQADVLSQTGLIEPIRLSLSGSWELRPAGKVGAVRVGQLEIRVVPKVSIDRLIFLLSFRLRGVFWQESDVRAEAADDMIQVLAEIYANAVASATRPGLLQGYRVAEEGLPVVRGRIRIDEQIKRRPGVWLPIEVTYDDFVVDTTENRVLRTALEILIRNPFVSDDLRFRLGGLLQQFAEVGRLVPGMPLPAWRITRLNRRYESALELARLVLESASFEHRQGEVRVDGYVLDVPKIFEDFVTLSLIDVLPAFSPGSAVIGQHKTFLDEGAEVELKPDVVWIDRRGVPLAVLDAKYKQEKVSGFPNADLYQCLAYGTVLGLNQAHLVYAKGNAEIKEFTVRHSGVVISAHALDLAQPPAQLLAQIRELATRVATMASNVSLGVA